MGAGSTHVCEGVNVCADTCGGAHVGQARILNVAQHQLSHCHFLHEGKL
jgi:hypothetical protein